MSVEIICMFICLISNKKVLLLSCVGRNPCYYSFFFSIFAFLFGGTATALSPAAFGSREESPGSTESPYFLTGRGVRRKLYVTASATENKPPSGKGENARQELTTWSSDTPWW